MSVEVEKAARDRRLASACQTALADFRQLCQPGHMSAKHPRNAATLGDQVVVPADCTADVSDAAHSASLTALYRSFADTCDAVTAVQLALGDA